MDEPSGASPPPLLTVRYDKFLFRVRPDCLYSEEDVWVRLDGAEAVIGLSDYRQQVIGDLTFATPRPSGTTVEKGEVVAELETMKTVLDVPSPLAGVIRSVNGSLAERPEVINQDPYGEGWLVRLAFVDGSEEGLLTAEQYADTLSRKAEEEAAR